MSENKLFELEPITMKIPDARIALSPEVTKPAPAPLSDNKPSFVIFRRDLVSRAPGKVFVRVFARVTRETKFVNAKATTTPIEQSWRIRSNALELKVSPVPGTQEMIHVHGEEDFSLAPGRYVLVLNGVGYDFSIPGERPSNAHCLEAFETASGTMFNECKL